MIRSKSRFMSGIQVLVDDSLRVRLRLPRLHNSGLRARTGIRAAQRLKSRTASILRLCATVMLHK